MSDAHETPAVPSEIPPAELEEWLESLDGFIAASGTGPTEQLIARLVERARRAGVPVAATLETPQVNTIPASRQPAFPGDVALERRIKSLVRWNAMAMVVRANRQAEGIGGHISTFASAATLYEVAFNHFFRGKDAGVDADQIYFQGHAAPGIYARAFLEGRLDESRVHNFRQELRATPGLSSYPHPWLMPDFWEFPTVSMGLGPIMAIYQARFNRYLEDRGLKPKGKGHVWAFLGDGETDEPESLGALTLASRAHLGNLIFVVNCNLQRLDGPVRGNGQIIQELERAFRGAGWHVIKVVLGSDWDPLLEKDPEGLIARRWSEVVDGEVQKYSVSDGAYIREHFWGKYPGLATLVEHLSDGELAKLNLGGHDPVKMYAAYRAAVEHDRGPVVILARTIKGYGLGEHGEGKNVTHQQKKMNEDELREFRTRFGIPISDEALASAPLYRPAPDSEEATYLRERRAALGGPAPARRVHCEPLPPPAPGLFEEFFAGAGDDRKVATTMAFVRLLAKLLRDEHVGRYVVPIVPDEARTFGMEALFRQCGIYSHVGQLYEPVDAKSLLYYKEVRDGQILEEGITEAGSMSSFIAAGTAYATHGIPTIPMFIYYSMFGFQRIGDLVWAAADMRCKGFMLGATAGRTTLAGEGLQHQDGHSHLLAYPVPQLEAYDPAYAYEIAVIVREGIRRMYEKMEDVFYYLTLANEPYAMPAMPAGVEEGILRGMYLLHRAPDDDSPRRVQLLGTGAILEEAVRARAILGERYGIAADVWSVTSYKALHRDALDVDRWNRLHPSRAPRVPYVAECLGSRRGPVVAASDYVRALPESIARFAPFPMTSLGTDGFGRSDGRKALRDFFEVDARHIALAALAALARTGVVEPPVVEQALTDLDIDPERVNPLLR
ncbi:MAG: pyruvate dehydrogenase (acetyl-transferring), homodimeric type [bacterium]|nr:pyruvate dehydrogenase (acetyl-transferring), homodimeric type [bacterium]